ncbi:MAG TPA: hypothetical protein ENK44_05075 [Caldithrix abyssi]|uniref:Uncharacterized protein n=1 Tax=Caldithrix abyssi TaxID=187145 RepID=A0A7V4WV79_CALAY|nr:hypothetical protein [Caldithrix abyssi]
MIFLIKNRLLVWGVSFILFHFTNACTIRPLASNRAAADENAAGNRNTNPIRIIAARAAYLKAVYDHSGNYAVTRRYPPVKNRARINGYLYRIEIVVIADGKEAQWDAPFVVGYATADGASGTITLNSQRKILRSHFQYSFYFTLQVKNKGERMVLWMGNTSNKAEVPLTKQWILTLD